MGAGLRRRRRGKGNRTLVLILPCPNTVGFYSSFKRNPCKVSMDIKQPDLHFRNIFYVIILEMYW
jgi:hypothetical protein